MKRDSVAEAEKTRYLPAMPKKTGKKDPSVTLVPAERIESAILLIRGHKVILDSDLAKLYGVTTSAFNRAVKRNAKRFLSDFMFALTKEEFDHLKCQFGTSSSCLRGSRQTLRSRLPGHPRVDATG